MERKEFIKSAFAFCGLAVVPAALLESCSKSVGAAPAVVNMTVDLSQSANAALNSVGGYKIDNGVIIIRASASQFYALSSVCTHEGCTVGYDSSRKNLVCPCHGGTFNASTGAVLAGPPPSGLQVYTVTQSGQILTIK